jgi:hypothetical protein
MAYRLLLGLRLLSVRSLSKIAHIYRLIVTRVVGNPAGASVSIKGFAVQPSDPGNQIQRQALVPERPIMLPPAHMGAPVMKKIAACAVAIVLGLVIEPLWPSRPSRRRGRP